MSVNLWDMLTCFVAASISGQLEFLAALLAQGMRSSCRRQPGCWPKQVRRQAAKLGHASCSKCGIYASVCFKVVERQATGWNVISGIFDHNQFSPVGFIQFKVYRPLS